MALEAGFRIGERDVFPLEGRISGPGGSLRVEPKAMAVLLELARHAGQVCTREQIVAAVWPRGYVSDDALTRCIGQLRRALGDDPRQPALLDTLPKRGYRLRRQTSALQALSAPQRLSTESLIVLPFRNLSATGEDMVCDGLTELLILRLCSLRTLRVLSRTTSMQFKAASTSMAEIVECTGVDWVIEGSVLQSGDRLQVIAQLIDARTDAHIWAADHVRDLRDLLPLLNEIAARLAAAIGVQLGARADAAPSLSPTVLREYLLGRQLISRRTVADIRDALAGFESVRAAAPDYADAWASRAECEMLLAHYGVQPQAPLLAGCESHLARALTLEPDSGIALSARGALRLFFDHDPDAAAQDLQRALSAMPSYGLAMVSMANVCAVRRQFAEATAWIEQALRLDPLDVGVNMNLGDHLILQRRFDDAVQALRRALQIAPGHRPSQLRCGWALALAGHTDAAAEMLASAAPFGGPDAAWLEVAALVAAAGDDQASARRHCAALQNLPPGQRPAAWSMARAAAAAGWHDKALDALAQAAAEHSSSMVFLWLTPAFDALHGHPRFQAMGAHLPGQGG